MELQSIGKAVMRLTTSRSAPLVGLQRSNRRIVHAPAAHIIRD
ncbi:hypothetical protein PA08_2212 [Cutibacterium modestum P08]|nr:hypothetical protein PA08_2212 [Cutibacterium modestum P08]